MTSATAVATMPTSSEMAPPYTTRENRSRPSSSVPNQCAADGAASVFSRSSL